MTTVALGSLIHVNLDVFFLQVLQNNIFLAQLYWYILIRGG